jgi:heptosyltransferase-2
VRRILVIRFGSLGDLCLLAWSLTRLGIASDERPHLTLVTKAAFADLIAGVPGIDDVVALSDSRPAAVVALARRLRRRRFDTIVDAHNILRSHFLLALLGRRPDRRLAKDTPARLALLWTRHRDRRLTRTMRDRFDELLAPLAAAGTFAGAPANPPLANIAEKPTTSTGYDPILGHAPGARWDTKRWPENNFAELLRRFHGHTPARVRVFLGPEEEAWFPGSELARAAADIETVELIRGRPLTEVASQMAGCAVLVTNDSGLMHLAEAMGVAVFAFFGPTVREFGYFPSLPASRVFETDLDCRPCSRNGKRPCHRGDLACLARLVPAGVFAALDRHCRWPRTNQKDGDA